MADAERIAEGVRRGRVQAALVAVLAPLGISRLLDAVGLAIFGGFSVLPGLRVAGYMISLTSGLACLSVLAWWLLSARPVLRADRADVGARAASLRSRLCGHGELAKRSYADRVAALEALAPGVRGSLAPGRNAS